MSMVSCVRSASSEKNRFQSLHESTKEDEMSHSKMIICLGTIALLAVIPNEGVTKVPPSLSSQPSMGIIEAQM